MTDHDTSGARAEPPGDHEWIDADDRPDGLAAPLHRLLAHVIDYAGLFPPSKLPMDRAVRDYAGFLGGAGDWIVDRFVVPVARLDEFETAAASHMPTDEMYEPWRISALAAAAGDEGFERDLDRIARLPKPRRGSRSSTRSSSAPPTRRPSTAPSPPWTRPSSPSSSSRRARTSAGSSRPSPGPRPGRRSAPAA